MPTYEYHCEKCDQNFEAFQSMRDKPFTQCPRELCRLPKWGRGKVKRQLGTGAGIIFKGSGFHVTDYRSKAYQEAARKEAPASGEKSSAGKDAKTSKTSTSTPSTKSKKESAG